MKGKEKAMGKIATIWDWLNRYAQFSDKLFKSGRHIDDVTAARTLSPLYLSASSSNRNESDQSIDVETPSEGIELRQRAVNSNAYNSQTDMQMATGFVCLQLLPPQSSITDERSKVTYRFLSDWERFWSFIADEESDEIAVQLPLMRVAVELIFHVRIIQLIYLVSLYNIIVMISLTVYFSSAPVSFTGGSLITIVIQFFTYIMLCALFRGRKIAFTPWRSDYNHGNEQFNNTRPLSTKSSMSGNSNNVNPDIITVEDNSVSGFNDDDDYNNDTTEVAQEATTQEFSLIVTMRRCWRRTSPELLQLFLPCMQKKTTNNRTPHVHASKEHAAGTKHALPNYYAWMNLALKILQRDYSQSFKRISSQFAMYRVLLIFSLVVFPLFALIYGYYQEATAWITACDPELDNPMYCRFTQMLLFLSCGGVTLVFTYVCFGMSLLVALAGLAYGCELAFRLAEGWIERFHSLRRVPLDNNVYDFTQNPQRLNVPEESRENPDVSSTASKAETNVAQMTAMVIDLVDRDAREHYLCLCALLRAAGEAWSPVIVLFVFNSLYVSLGTTVNVTLAFIMARETHTRFTALELQTVIHSMIFVAIRIFLLFLYPIISISLANANLLRLWDVFRYADENDFQVLGGRDRWLKLFVDTPAVWSFFGLAITPERLTAVLWTILATVGGVMLTTLINNTGA